MLFIYVSVYFCTFIVVSRIIQKSLTMNKNSQKDSKELVIGLITTQKKN